MSTGHTLTQQTSAVAHPGFALADSAARLARAGSLAELLPILATGALEISELNRAVVLAVDRRGATDTATARDPEGLLDAPLLSDVRGSVGRRGIVDVVMASNRPVWKAAEDLVVHHEPWLERHGVRGLLGVPIPMRTGAATLLLTSPTTVSPSDDVLASLEQLADVAGAIIDATRRLEDERGGRRVSELLLRELETIASSTDGRQVLRAAAEAIKNNTEDETTTAATVVDGQMGLVEAQGDRLHASAVLDQVNRAGTISGATQVDLGDPAWSTVRAHGIERLLVVPVVAGGDAEPKAPIGWIVSYGSSRRRYGNQDLKVAETVARQTSMALANVARLKAERDALMRLEELDRLKSGFVASLSHGLRTPLTALVGYSELLAEQSENDPSLYFANDMRREAAQLHTLIGNLLDASRLEAGMLQLNPRPLDAVAMVGEAIEAARHAHPTRVVEFHSDVERFAMVADAERIRQVFAILFDNGLRYSPENAPLDVTVMASAEYGPSGLLQNGVRVHVDDRGPGIDEADRERIFERFARVRDDIEGTGIGLFLARELVRAHAGTILVDDRDGGGTRFSVWLPQDAS